MVYIALIAMLMVVAGYLRQWADSGDRDISHNQNVAERRAGLARCSRI